MKNLLFLSSFMILISCASNSEIQQRSEKHSFATHQALKQKVAAVIDAHNEFNDKQKSDLKKIFNSGLEMSQKLKIQESKLTQEMMESVLVGNKKSDLDKFRKEFRKVYKLKMKNINDTSNKIKGIINPQYRQAIIQEFIGIRSENFDRASRL